MLLWNLTTSSRIWLEIIRIYKSTASLAAANEAVDAICSGEPDGYF